MTLCQQDKNHSLYEIKTNFTVNSSKLRTENILREHMKSQHFQFVSNCKNEVDYRFGPKKCWFIYKEDMEIAYENAKCEGQIIDNNMIYDME